MNNIIGVIGAGNMGMAIAEAWLEKDIVKPEQLLVFDRQAKDHNHNTIHFENDDIALLESASVVLLAVKPQHIEEVSAQYAKHIRNKVIISILAGTTCAKISTLFSNNKIIRWMPNMAVKSGKGIVGYFMHDVLDPSEIELHSALTSIFTLIKECSTEDDINVITALSGSAPAFYYYFASGLESAATAYGFSDEDAVLLTALVFSGSADLFFSSGQDFESMIARIASKGGTTEAGLRIMKEQDLHELIKQAVDAAVKRAEELN